MIGFALRGGRAARIFPEFSLRFIKARKQWNFRMIRLEQMVKYILQEMLDELESRRLEVILVRQREPANPGACIRVASGCNCEWYRMLCGDFESQRRRRYRKFKTKVKRREIRRLLDRLISGRECRSVYADWLCRYARSVLEQYRNESAWEWTEGA